MMVALLIAMHVLMHSIFNAQFIAGMHLLTTERGKLDYEAASRHCTSIGHVKGALPMPKSKTDQDKLQEQMEHDRFSSIWLGGKRHVQDQWTLLDGSENGVFPVENQLGKHCAVFNQSQLIPQAAHCANKYPGHICEVTNCHSCNKKYFGWKSQVCRKYRSSCFLFYCDNVNWFNARNTCGTNGWDLASLYDREMTRWLSKQQFNCKTFWVGLRREWWGMKGETDTTFAAWKDGEPSGGNCIQLRLSDITSHWVTSNCSIGTHTICSFEQSFIAKPDTGRQNGVGLNNTTGVPEPENQSSQTNIIIGIVLGLILVVVLGVGLFLYLKKRRTISGENKRQEMERFAKESLIMKDKQAVGESAKARNEVPPEEKQTETGNDTLKNELITSTEPYTLVNMSTKGRVEGIPVKQIYTNVIWKKSSEKNLKTACYEHIFKQSDTGLTLTNTLIYGDNGVGKTTLIRNLLHDWCALDNHAKQSCLRQFRYVIYLALMDAEDNVNLLDIMSHILNMNGEEKLILDNIKLEPGKTLIIFDGYGEFKAKAKQETEVDKIIFGKFLKGVQFIVTCRVDMKNYLASKRRAFGNMYRIYGFTDEGVENYISKYPFDKPEGAFHLRKKMKDMESLRALSKYPHYLRLFCTEVCSEEYKSPTWPYNQLLKYSWKRYAMKYKKDSVIKKDETDWIKYEPFHRIGKLAMKSLAELKSEKIHTFSEGNIDDEMKDLGFFVYKDEDCPSFPHDELHVYFAAYFVSFNTKDTKENHLNELLSSKCEEDKKEKLLEFVAGLMQENRERLGVLKSVLSSFHKEEEHFLTSLDEELVDLYNSLKQDE